ncbi:merozoite surface protein 7 [Plasmodium gonderi]|uniref:Merozoite surface protein 7 n=1 Tax=Plasmodium gonderi TaxID=77519 RepID=A0A1Y1JJ14_PLAGO|nr:merozoite surface protein 7 [Plasmodium gonderi]GAW82220.1 merozoite surface protein 7 [Plasmodium gonderi]
MKGKIGVNCCFFLFLFCCVVSEKIGPQKKKKNLEEDAAHMLMKKLEKLYKLNETNNGEIFNKEIESLKKQIEALHQGKVDSSEGNIAQLLENESKDEFGQKTIFGMDEEDLDNYDADFIGQSKGKIMGQSGEIVAVQGNDTEQVQEVKSESLASPAEDQTDEESIVVKSPGGSVEVGLENVQNPQTVQQEAVPVTGSTEGQRADQSADGHTQVEQVTQPEADSSRSSAVGNPGSPEVSGTEQPQEGGSRQPAASAEVPSEPAAIPPATPPAALDSAKESKIKYLDKLYDEVLTTCDNRSGINAPDYHSKYNTIKTKYELSMNPVEYEIVKNMFNAGFKKEDDMNTNPLVDIFKKVLTEEKFQNEFDNFVSGLYGFAKRHNYLSEERMKNNTENTNLVENAINLLNTIEVV